MGKKTKGVECIEVKGKDCFKREKEVKSVNCNEKVSSGLRSISEVVGGEETVI